MLSDGVHRSPHIVSVCIHTYDTRVSIALTCLKNQYNRDLAAAQMNERNDHV